jgi:hypothetical protein
MVRSWTDELVRLRKDGYEVNYERIIALEKNLNDASERYVLDRLSNFVKTDLLNAEKMTPRFLKIAESFNSDDQSVIKDNNGTAFPDEKSRNEHITNFYRDLYKMPVGARTNFENCIENFLGELTNHPVITGCMLSEEERDSLERAVTVEELDEAVEGVNLNSAPGIDGVSNRYIKKFWVFFREPLLWYVS